MRRGVDSVNAFRALIEIGDKTHSPSPHVPPRRINEIVLGKRDITADTDMRLARYFGVSDGFFLGLQAEYDPMQKRREIECDLAAIDPRAA